MPKIKRKLFKLLFILILVIVLSFFSFLFYIKNSINLDNIKNSINSSALEKIKEYNKNYHFKDKDIKFAIRGSINISIFPSIKIVVNDFDMKNIQYKDFIINTNVKKIELNLSFLDFLNKKINVKDCVLNGINTYVNYNKLDDFYYKIEKVKKIVKIDNNEIFGVKDKLKSLLISSDIKEVPVIEEGYKEIEVEEKVKYDVDNNLVKFMLIDIFKSLKYNDIRLNNISFSNSYLVFLRNGNIQKEFKNVNGTIKNKILLNSNFILNNINGSFELKLSKDNNLYKYNFKIINDQKDEIKINLLGDDLINKNFDSSKYDIDLSFKAINFNVLVQWLFPIDSKFYYMFDYKKNIDIKTKIKKNSLNYDFSDFVINSKDIKLSADIKLNDDLNNFDIKIDKLDFNELIVNLPKNKITKNYDTINIFNNNSFEDFIISLKKDKNIKNIKFNMFVNELINKDKNIKNSNLSFEIINGVYKINKLDLNFNNFKVYSKEPKEINGVFYNDFNIDGDNLSTLANIINLNNFININKFSLKSKLLVSNDTIYLYDYVINDENNNKISEGDFEYSFKKDDNHIALNSYLSKLSFNSESKKNTTIKEKFIWLNNITSNVFLNLKVDELNYNNKKINLDTKIHYYPGYVNFYKINNIDIDNIKGISGNFLLVLNSDKPIVKYSIYIKDINYEDNIIDYVFDTEKYKNALIDKEIDKTIQDKYWINKLFSLPTFEEIDGEFNLKIGNLKINNALINNFNLDSKMNNGLLNINNLTFNGLGGYTDIKGSIDMKKSKNINLILSDTIYDIDEFFKIFTKKENNYIKGKIGVGGIIKAVGFNPSVFLASMNLNFKFISNNLYIRMLGLEKMRDDLNKIYKDDSILNNFDAKSMIINNTGTTFNDVSGSLLLSSNINVMNMELKANSISDNFYMKMDNSGKSMLIDAINTSVILTKVANNDIKLYSTIKFKEGNKAKLDINTSQIDEYIKTVKKTKEKVNK